MAEQPSHAALTPEGVRAGAPAALAVLVDRRGPAVLAFCEAVCDPADAGSACAEAFARFRGAVAASPDARALDPDALLLSATRHAAAARARVAVPDAPSRFGRLLHRHDDATACAEVPGLLVARAEGTMSGPDAERLVVHLRADAGCRAVEDAFDAAEASFAEPPGTPLPLEVLSDVLAAMVAVAPITAAPEALEELPATPPPAVTPSAEPAPVVREGDDGDGTGPASAAPGAPPAPRRGASSSTPVGLRPVRSAPEPEATPAPAVEEEDGPEPAAFAADEPTAERPALALPRLRRRHGPLFDVVLPLGLVGVAAAAALAVSGALDGSSGATPREASSAPPVVAAPAVSEATATSASKAASRRVAVERLERDRERRERRALRATREAEAAVAATTP